MTTAPIGRVGNTFGGDWTEEKLGILEAYLDAYTTALKSKPFRLVYVDAFAGTGWVKLDSGSGHETDREDRERLIAGSAERALRVTDRPFDRLVFVENDPERYEDLCGLREHHPDRGIDPRKDDANSFLCGLSQSEYGTWRGVLFIDPFGTQVAWRTLEHVAQLERLDTWILFPAGAVARMLPRSRKPDDVDPKWAQCLNTVFGDDRWRSLYSAPAQHDSFGQGGAERQAGVSGLLTIFKHRLETAFGRRFLRDSRTLRNSRNSPLFEFLFCVGHPSGASIAKRIAGHIIERM